MKQVCDRRVADGQGPFGPATPAKQESRTAAWVIQPARRVEVTTPQPPKLLDRLEQGGRQETGDWRQETWIRNSGVGKGLCKKGS